MDPAASTTSLSTALSWTTLSSILSSIAPTDTSAVGETPQPSDTQHHTQGHPAAWTAAGVSAMLLCVGFSLVGIWCLKRRYPDPLDANRSRSAPRLTQELAFGSVNSGISGTTATTAAAASTLVGGGNNVELGKKELHGKL